MNSTTLDPTAKLAVRFTARWQLYYPGDVATFPARMAVALVARGKAEKVNIAPPGVSLPAGAELAMRRPGTHVIKGRIEDDLDI